MNEFDTIKADYLKSLTDEERRELFTFVANTIMKAVIETFEKWNKEKL